MLDYLLDNLNRVFGQPEYARWRRVVGAFCLKYPDVYVDTGKLKNRVPGSFLVWRIGINHHPSVFFSSSKYSSTPGAYVVQLFPGSGLAAEFEWARLSKQNVGVFASDTKSAGNKTVITGFGKFGYDGEIGELVAEYHDHFYDMVLREDAQRYRDMRNRIKQVL